MDEPNIVGVYILNRSRRVEPPRMLTTLELDEKVSREMREHNLREEERARREEERIRSNPVLFEAREKERKRQEEARARAYEDIDRIHREIRENKSKKSKSRKKKSSSSPKKKNPTVGKVVKKSAPKKSTRKTPIAGASRTKRTVAAIRSAFGAVKSWISTHA